jgi:hypothetical protein
MQQVGVQSQKSEKVSSIYIALICFLTYACIYAFRKPFTVGLYIDMPSFWGIEFKNLLVIAQVLGYAASKIFGIKFIAELKNVGRGKLIFYLILLSLLPLLLLPLVPIPFKIICMFLNGFPLGITWGIIFSYVEGRKTTDFIGATLAVSFIVSSGMVKSVAKWLQLQYHIIELWLPFCTGLIFLLPVMALLYLLEKIPPPTKEEQSIKSARTQMTQTERALFFKKFMPGLILLIIVYVVLTLFRDLRDNFAADIWNNLGYGKSIGAFTNTELPIAIIVLILIASMIAIRNNKIAFLISLIIILLSFLIVGVSTWFFQHHYLNGFNWMLLVGLGLYMGYIPYNSILFDRMIATFKLRGNVGYFMYLMDSFGYIASVLVISIKNISHLKLNWADFYSTGVYYFSMIGLVISVISLFYYIKKIKSIPYES